MPELPEVETVRKGLLNTINGLNINSIKIINPKLRYDIPHKLEKIFRNKTIKSIIRRGKHGIIITNADYHFHFHLGMTGTFKVTKGTNVQIKKHDHLLIRLSKKINLIYNDVRKFGYISIINKPFDIIQFKNLGYEPSLLNLPINEVIEKVRMKKKSVKCLLLDQSILAGVGNIYANEILFDSSIHPETLVIKLSNQKISKILESSLKIIKKAIIKGGSSIKDYTNIKGDLGYFQNEFKVYGKEGLPCVKCKSLIIKIKQMGRATYFCSKCQKVGT